MYKDLKFPVLIVHRDIKADTVAGDRVRGIARELEQEGFSIVSAVDYAEGRLVASTHHGLACMLIAAEDASTNSHLLQNMAELIGLARVRAPDLPIFALGEQVTLENAPADAMAELNQLRGILYLFEDTVPFLARQVARAARKYLDGLLPPFFKALVQHTADSNYSWHTPGHGGGVAYHKSPVGQAFHQFFGENTLRSDLSVSVPELGSLLDHTGPLAEAEARAARNFGADHTFFVINGTSTANKIVWHSMVARDDLVLVDRNCHKSVLHSIIMTGAIPLYLCPERNELGIIGPIPLSEFSRESIQAKIDASPLTKGRAPKVKLAVVTNSTYDGLCYNAELIKQSLGNSVEVLHFDEAWYAYAAFHEFFAGRYGMGTSRSEDSPLVFTTHSTHKLLAAFSQASMIHVQDGGARQLDRDRFNEAFMMHISTSPQYSIIASLDVASAMMEGPAGRSLLQEMFDEALSFRRALANLRQHIAADDWWFSIWQPPSVEGIDRVRHRRLAAATRGRLAWLWRCDRRLRVARSDQSHPGDAGPDRRRRVERARDSGGGGQQVPLGARAGGREDRAVFVPGAVLHGHHQRQMEHAAHRVAGVQAQLRRQRQPGHLPAVCGATETPRVIRAWACATCAINCTPVIAAMPRPNTSNACTPCCRKSP